MRCGIQLDGCQEGQHGTVYLGLHIKITRKKLWACRACWRAFAEPSLQREEKQREEQAKRFPASRPDLVPDWL